MSRTSLHLDSKGHAWTYADMETTGRDFARLGMLMLQRGRWEGSQIVSSAWIDSSTSPSQKLNPRYGLLWWLDPAARAYAAHGHLDTDLHVLPQSGLIVVRMQARPFPGGKEGEYEREALLLFPKIVPNAHNARLSPDADPGKKAASPPRRKYHVPADVRPPQIHHFRLTSIGPRVLRLHTTGLPDWPRPT
jgi:hypothetical protein